MIKNTEKEKNYTRNYPRFVQILMLKKRYSAPKLHIPRVNGRPSVDANKPWYVYFYWRSKPDGPLDKKYTYRKGINTFKKASERRAAGNALKDAYAEALGRNWNPETKTVSEKEIKKTTFYTVEKAFKLALSIKAANKKQSTIDGYEFHGNRFLKWCKANGYLGMDVKKFSIDNFYEYLDYMRNEYKSESTGKRLSGTSINNHRRNLSALFTTLKNERIISNNFVKDVPQVEQKPVNNRAFSITQLKAIKKMLVKEDPYLILFISFLLYPLLRPAEICRLKIKDIDTDNWILNVETKTEANSYRRIIKKLQPILKKMELHKYPGDYFVFSNLDKPAPWEVKKLKSKVDHFTTRFKKIKKKLGLGREYGIYSFRHTAILDLYNSLVDEGFSEQEILLKLMPITKHKSIAGIKNYLREHKKSIPKDHSDIYKIDF